MADLTTPLDPADVDALCAFLRDGGEVPNPDLAVECATDPSELNLPGVLVQLEAVELDRLGGVTIGLRLVCLAPEAAYASWPILADLWNRVTTLVSPSGRTTAVTMTLPGSSTALPALSIPYDLLTTV